MTAQQPPFSRRTTGLLLVLILTAAVWLRSQALGTEDYWLDEVLSLVASAGATGQLANIPDNVILEDFPRPGELTEASRWPAVWAGLRWDVHPPLYFLLLNTWRRIGGDREFWVRLTALIPSALSTLFVYGALCRRHPQTALWAALLSAVAFAPIQLGQEARPYSLALCLTAASFYLLVRMTESWAAWTPRQRTGGAAAYGATVFGVLLTHYLAALALLAQVVYLLVCAWRIRRAHGGRESADGAGGTEQAQNAPETGHSADRRRAPAQDPAASTRAAPKSRRFPSRPWIAAALLSGGVAGLTFLLVWGPSLAAQRRHAEDHSWLLEKRPVLYAAVRLANLPMRLMFQQERLPDLVPKSWGLAEWSQGNLNAGHAVLGVVLLAAAAYLLLIYRRTASQSPPSEARSMDLLFALWYAVPAGVLAAVDLTAGTGLLGHLRYPLLAAPGLSGMLALAAGRLPGRSGHVLLGVLALGSLVLLKSPFREKPDAMPLAHLLHTLREPGELLVFDGIGGSGRYAARMHLVLSPYSRDIKGPILLLEEQPVAELQAQLAGFQRIFFLIGRDSIPELLQSTLHYITGSHELIGVSEHYFHGFGAVVVAQKRAPE